MDDENEMKEAPLERAEKAGNTFTLLGTAISGLCGLVAGGFVFGLFFGGVIRDTPSRLDSIDVKMTSIQSDVTDLKYGLPAIRDRVSRIEASDEKQWQKISEIEPKAAAAVSEKAFYLWRIDFERANRNVTAPPLQ